MTQHSPSIAAQIRQQLREVAETWTDDDGEVDLVNLDTAIEIVDKHLSGAPVVTYRQAMETR